MGRVQRRIVRGVLAVVEHPKATLAIAAAVLIACATWAFLRLDISTDTNKLFSPRVKFFADWLDYFHKFPENEAIYVIIQPRDAAAPAPPLQRWTGAADAVVDRMKLIPEHVASAHARVPIEKLGDQGLLFDDPKRVRQAAEEVREFVPLVKLWGEKPSLLERALGPTPTDRFLSGLSLRKPDARDAPFIGMLADSWTRTIDAGHV